MADAPSRVLVINCGSSSVKYSLLDPASGVVEASGLAERIGDGGRLTHRGADAAPSSQDRDLPDHHAAVEAVLAALEDDGADLAGLTAVGHRIVHGGRRFTRPTLVDDDVVAAVEDLAVLAPLHNPAGVEGMRALRAAVPDVPQVAVFDTAFHATLPPEAATYAVPRRWREEYGVRRYGFHGTSHAYVSRETARFLGREPAETNCIVLHLGNGASACAVRGGRSIETSMGMTPLAGLVMGTRSGDVDPAVTAHLVRSAGMTAEEVEHDLESASGLLGLCGAGDMREVTRRADEGDEDAVLALEVYCHRIRLIVGAYVAVLGHVDAVTFTAGVGEHAPDVRGLALDGLAHLGIEVDSALNTAADGGARRIGRAGTAVEVLVVPTNEELEIARQTLDAAGGAAGDPGG